MSSTSNRMIVGMLVVALLAAGFWILLLSPKRQEASELAAEVEQQQAALTQAQARLNEATTAERAFPVDYHQLVVLGGAVPAGDETASLLVELNRVAKRAKVRFDSLQLDSSSEGSAPTSTATAQQVGPTSAVPASQAVPPTEAAAALLPLGASIGSAGLGVMPYDLTFTGSFFHVADFIHGIDALVHTKGSKIGVDGRLVTLDAFSLSEDSGTSFPNLSADFSVTTYLLPPSQGLTAGATTASPGGEMQLSAATTGASGESAGGESTGAPR